MTNKTVRIINLLVPTIKDGASTEAEKHSAQLALAKRCWKLLEGVGFSKSCVHDMHVCRELIELFIYGEIRLKNGRDDYEINSVRLTLENYGVSANFIHQARGYTKSHGGYTKINLNK